MERDVQLAAVSRLKEMASLGRAAEADESLIESLISVRGETHLKVQILRGRIVEVYGMNLDEKEARGGNEKSEEERDIDLIDSILADFNQHSQKS